MYVVRFCRWRLGGKERRVSFNLASMIDENI